MAVQPNYPAATPSLLLDFANNKRLDPRITFTRTTTATYYDGSTTAKAEENLLVQSQDFTTTWGPTNITVTANTTTAPDGTSTADTLTGSNSTNNNKNIVQTIGTISGNYTFSFFAKANTHNIIQVLFFGGVNPSFGGYVNYDLSTGTLGSYDAVGTPTIINVGNGWYRCIYSTIFTLQTYAVITLIDSTTASRFATSASTNSIYIWGAQLEQRSSVTAYTATTTQAITNYIPVLQTASAGQARFDHNPTTDESLGLLVEEARTNLLVRSQEFDTAGWTKSNCSITANIVVAPDGTLTGDKVVENTAASVNHVVQQASITITAGASVTLSLYIKAAERSRFEMRISNAGDRLIAEFNTTTGTVTNSYVTGTSTLSGTTITNVGNSWYRITVSGVVNASSTSVTAQLFMQDNSSYNTYTGDGTSGIYIWGAQLEAGAFVTSYIPTVAAQVTRNADVANIAGNNFTSWYNASEGTVYIEAQTAATNGGFMTLQDGSVANYMRLNRESGNSKLRLLIEVSSGVQTNIFSVANVTVNTFVKVTLSYKFNDAAVCLNSESAVTNTSVVLPNPTELNIGFGKYLTYVNGTIKKIAYYPLRLTNAQLQALTS